MVDSDGTIFYSTVVPLINANSGIDVLNIAPNPVAGNNFNLRLSAAKQQELEMFITDLAGRTVQHNMVNLIAGFNIIPVNIKGLANSMYQLHAKTADGQTTVLKFAVQH
jgi:hypothetical protein